MQDGAAQNRKVCHRRILSSSPIVHLHLKVGNRQVLSYPEERLACDLGLLLLMAALEALSLFLGASGNLKEREGPVVGSLVLSGTTMLLSVYFLAWQSYVLRADLVLNAILLGVYSLGGVLAFVTVARFTSINS
ncbi:transmembrane protein 80-like isoform X2 [Gadus macrocephalus]|uniref:transmembrane protein 80-like isoform X2 n=1 Tax=Gadus macrocephalus TaxID=80720 RepID=UPI0028CB52B1|nr:transmembrane protein 80-like isoform X2 [Gadus macrocephalus]